MKGTRGRLRGLATMAAAGVLVAGGLARPAEAQTFRRTVVVGPGGTPVASGTRLLTALAGISAHAGRPYLLKVEPGTYDLGAASLVMKPYVDIEGSGEGLTRISSVVDREGTVSAAPNSALRQISVLNGGAAEAVALRVTAGPFTAQHVTVVAEGGTSYNGALVNRTTDATFVHLTAWATGSNSTTAISTDGGHLRHVRAYAKGGRVVYALFSGGSHGEIVDAVAEARATGFAGAIRNEAGAPTLRNVRAYAEGLMADGIVNGAATGARIYGAVIQARGGAEFAHGIRNEFADVVISGADIEVTADTRAYGVLTFLGGRCALVDVRIGVVAGGGGRGVFSDDGVVTTIDRSTVQGDEWSVAHGYGPAATRSQVGGSRLEGPVDAATGTITCAFSYDGALVPLDRGCRPAP